MQSLETSNTSQEYWDEVLNSEAIDLLEHDHPASEYPFCDPDIFDGYDYMGYGRGSTSIDATRGYQAGKIYTVATEDRNNKVEVPAQNIQEQGASQITETQLRGIVQPDSYPHPEEVAVKNDLSRRLNDFLNDDGSAVSERQRKVLRLRYGIGTGKEPMTLSEVGEEIGVSSVRVRQIGSVCMRKLQEPFFAKKYGLGVDKDKPRATQKNVKQEDGERIKAGRSVDTAVAEEEEVIIQIQLAITNNFEDKTKSSNEPRATPTEKDLEKNTPIKPSIWSRVKRRMTGQNRST